MGSFLELEPLKTGNGFDLSLEDKNSNYLLNKLSLNFGARRQKKNINDEQTNM